jgi:hypothetical protein
MWTWLFSEAIGPKENAPLPNEEGQFVMRAAEALPGEITDQAISLRPALYLFDNGFAHCLFCEATTWQS